MHITTVTILALSAAWVQANSLLNTIVKRQDVSIPLGSNGSPAQQHFVAVCLPYAKEYPDTNAPCWQVGLLEEQCVFGSEYTFSGINHPNMTYNSSREYPSASARDQQTCLCGTDFFAALQGCVACADKHGLTGAVPDYAPASVTSVSSSYCAATYTATANLTDALASGFAAYKSASYDIFTATTYTDPLGSATDVSLYYTPSVTGSAAYIVTTTASTLGSASSAASATGSQIAQTASSTTSSRNNALETAASERYAIAGIVGLAAMVAAL